MIERQSGGDPRETLRRELIDHRRLTEAQTKLSNRLRALLLTGAAADRRIARGRLGAAVLVDLTKRSEPEDGADDIIVRGGEIRRLAVEVCDCRTELVANQDRIRAIVNELSPGLTTHHRVGPIRAAEIILDGG